MDHTSQRYGKGKLFAIRFVHHMATLGVPSVTEGERLVMEMEFVQCLANPAYLACTLILCFMGVSGSLQTSPGSGWLLRGCQVCGLPRVLALLEGPRICQLFDVSRGGGGYYVRYSSCRSVALLIGIPTD